MPIGDIKPAVSGVISKMLGQRVYRAQPEDEGMTQTMPGTYSRSEFGLPQFDPASARYSPIPTDRILTPAQRGRESAPGPGDIGGGQPGSSPAQPGQPPVPTGPGLPGTPGAPTGPGGIGTGPGGGSTGPGTGPGGGTSPGGGAGAGRGDPSTSPPEHDPGFEQGHGDPSQNQQPGAAKGGIVRGPKRLWLGEEGDEAVIPLNNPVAAQRVANQIARGAIGRKNWQVALNALKRAAPAKSDQSGLRPKDDGDNSWDKPQPYWPMDPKRSMPA